MLPVRLVDCGIGGVREALITDKDMHWQPLLDWDRFTRLSYTANRVAGLALGSTVLDVGGGDGALALFLPDHRVWVVDPSTTGSIGVVLPFMDKQFPLVVSVDSLEHIVRSDRPLFVRELVRVCSYRLFLHFPEAHSMDAQCLAHRFVPDHTFIREHVEFVLPSEQDAKALIHTAADTRRYELSVTYHTSATMWLLWFVLHHRGLDIDGHLRNFLQQQDTNGSPHLYCLCDCQFNL